MRSRGWRRRVVVWVVVLGTVAGCHNPTPANVIEVVNSSRVDLEMRGAGGEDLWIGDAHVSSARLEDQDSERIWVMLDACLGQDLELVDGEGEVRVVFEEPCGGDRLSIWAETLDTDPGE